MKAADIVDSIERRMARRRARLAKLTNASKRRKLSRELERDHSELMRFQAAEARAQG